MQLPQPFNSNEVEPNQPLQAIPTGWYNCLIQKEEQKSTKANDGSWYLQLQMQVIEGEHTGAVLFDRLNLQNNNQQTMEIAYRQLSGLCRAAGIATLTDTQQLLQQVVCAHAKLVPAETNPMTGEVVYDAKNDINGYEPRRAMTPAAPGAVPGQAAAVPGPVPGMPAAQPWQAPPAAPAPVPGQPVAVPGAPPAVPGGPAPAIPGQVPGVVPGQVPGQPTAVPGQVPGQPAVAPNPAAPAPAAPTAVVPGQVPGQQQQAAPAPVPGQPPAQPAVPQQQPGQPPAAGMTPPATPPWEQGGQASPQGDDDWSDDKIPF